MKRRFINTAVIALIIALVNASVCVYAENRDNSYEGSHEDSSDAPSSEAPSAGAGYAPGEVIVSFSEDLSPKKERAILQDAVESVESNEDSAKGEEVAEYSEGAGSSSNAEADKLQITELDSNTVLLGTEGTADVPELIEELMDNPAIEDAQPNYYYTVDSGKSTGLETKNSMFKTWYMDYLDVPEAWAAIEKYQKDGTIENPSERVVIATLDSGIYLNHEDESDIRKGGNFDLAHCKTTVSGIDPDGDSYDPRAGSVTAYPNSLMSHGNSTSSVIGATSGNGKGIAGIAAGRNNNIASVMAINVFRKNINSEHKATSADIIAGIDYACRHNAKVIMMCLGHAPGSTDGTGKKVDDAALEDKINWATDEKDVVFVASAGNRNSSSTWYPSDFDACVSVINTVRYTNIDSRNCRYSSSSFGPKKDISAPGTGIMHCTMSRSGYTAGTGTSYSAPIVASIAGLVRYVNPSLSQQEVKDILYSTATDLYTPGYDIYTGYGNVNAYAAVTAATGNPTRISPRKLVPTKLSAKSAGKSAINLTWKNVGAGRYSIYRSTNPDSGFSYIRAVTGTSYTDTGLTFNKYYYYKIIPRGTSKDGKRIDGNISSVAASAAICGKPSLTVKAKGKHIARVSWSRAKDASGYQIYKSAYPNRDFKCINTINGSKKGSRTIRNLKSKKKYYYKVRAYIKRNGKKYYGPFSSVIARRQ